MATRGRPANTEKSTALSTVLFDRQLKEIDSARGVCKPIISRAEVLRVIVDYVLEHHDLAFLLLQRKAINESGEARKD